MIAIHAVPSSEATVRRWTRGTTSTTTAMTAPPALEQVRVYALAVRLRDHLAMEPIDWAAEASVWAEESELWAEDAWRVAGEIMMDS